MAGVGTQHHNAVGHTHGLVNIMRHHQHRARWHRLLAPQAQEFLAQVGRRQHVQRAEGLVHEQQLRLDDQRTRKANTLAHSAGEFFGVGILEAIQTDQVDRRQGAPEALGLCERLCLEPQFHILQHCEPGEEGEGLEYDRHVRVGSRLRGAPKEHLAGRGCQKPRQNAQ
jgi:hypothetical protein